MCVFNGLQIIVLSTSNYHHQSAVYLIHYFFNSLIIDHIENEFIEFYFSLNYLRQCLNFLISQKGNILRQLTWIMPIL